MPLISDTAFLTWLASAEFAAKWDKYYPAVSQIWLRHWENIIPIFDYPM